MTPRKPKAKPGLAKWIEANVYLPEGFVAEPGPMRLYPYQREMADCIGDPSIERVTVLKASRIGYTALLTGALGYWCTVEPGPILVLLPTEADARDFVCSDIETTFAASPALQSVLVDESRVGQRGRPLKGLQMRNTVLSRRFEAGSLKVVPARAPRNLRRHSARYLVFDECSAMENSVEGDVVALAEKRTLSFANRKIVLGSTPLHEDDHVCRAYAASDMRVFELPCPDCGAFFRDPLGFDRMAERRARAGLVEVSALRGAHTSPGQGANAAGGPLEGHGAACERPCRLQTERACVAARQCELGQVGGRIFEGQG
jgi:phage terminase large subunit GpA-like protein